jgi:transposase
MPKKEILKLKSAPRLEQVGDNCPKQMEHRKHRVDDELILPHRANRTDGIFGNDRRVSMGSGSTAPWRRKGSKAMWSVRERKALITERVRHSNRIKGLLFTQGISKYEPLRRDRRARLAALRTGDGRELPAHLKAQISRELDRLELLLEQLKAVEAERDALLAQEQVHANAPAGMLLKLKGIGPEFAAILWSEGLFRHYDNRRQLAAYAGLAPTPWQSGQIDREQGVSKAGNPRLRVALIQLSWLWLQHQSQSALARWFETRVARNGGRLRKSTIVALARKLLVALWKYVNAGVAIEGAVLAS